jgi:nucleotide-binding universal stress UspA family protein
VIDQLLIATDGSGSGERAVVVALDLAHRFDATTHALSVVDTTGENEGKANVEGDGGSGDAEARRRRAEEAVDAVAKQTDREVRMAVREGVPAEAVRSYAEESAADLVATGTRGRHGTHRFLLGSVAEEIVRTCPAPVLTVRQLDDSDGDGNDDDDADI